MTAAVLLFIRQSLCFNRGLSYDLKITLTLQAILFAGNTTDLLQNLRSVIAEKTKIQIIPFKMIMKTFSVCYPLGLQPGGGSSLWRQQPFPLNTVCIPEMLPNPCKQHSCFGKQKPQRKKKT